MSNLKLITTENFGNISCDFYRNMNDDILLTREQIGSALEYTNPRTAIKNIHRKHKDRLDELSIRIKSGGYQNEPTSKSEEQERVYYTERGIMEICRWSHLQPECFRTLPLPQRYRPRRQDLRQISDRSSQGSRR